MCIFNNYDFYVFSVTFVLLVLTIIMKGYRPLCYGILMQLRTLVMFHTNPVLLVIDNYYWVLCQ